MLIIQIVTELLFELQVTYEKELGKQATSPKHGKVDPKGAPHVGGNTWAGGTGREFYMQTLDWD